MSEDNITPPEVKSPKKETSKTVGRKPFKITKKHLQQIEELAANFDFERDIAASIGIAATTFIKLKSQNPEIAAAIEAGHRKGRRDVMSIIWKIARGDARDRMAALEKLWGRAGLNKPDADTSDGEKNPTDFGFKVTIIEKEPKEPPSE